MKADIVRRYSHNPILTKKDIPYPVETVHNAAVVKHKNEYIMLFRSHLRTYGIADFTQAIRVDPKNVAAYDERASAYERAGAHDRALADIAQAIKLDPQNPDAHRLQ
jgi:Flp pilus assembly protein TadD